MTALPKLKDFLSEDLDLSAETPVDPVVSALAEVTRAFLAQEEARMTILERSCTSIQGSIERFLDAVEARLPQLDDEDIAAAFRDLTENDKTEYLRKALSNAEAKRKKAFGLRNNDLKARSLALTEREIRAVRAAYNAFVLAERRLLKMRDLALVQEAQAMTTSFWDSDEPDS